MNRLHLSLLPILLAAGLVLTGCDQVRTPLNAPGRGSDAPPAGEEPVLPPAEEVAGDDPAAELPVRPSAAGAEAVIDWEAARRDLASRPIEEREGSFQVASGDAAPPVPVFLPSNPVAAQSGEAAVRFQPVRDGYYAFFPGDEYDIIVNGTNKVIAAPGETIQPRSEALNFQPTTDGVQVAFSRYGADYLVEFQCKQLTNGLPLCITEEDAIAFAEDLVISGTR